MTAARQRLEADLRAALKAGEKDRLGTIRMLLSEVNNERIRLGREVDEGEFVAVVRRAIKQRREATEQYARGGRPELAAKEEREADILGGYLPAQAGEPELRHAIEEMVRAEGLSGPAALGRVMKATMARYAGRADGATVQRLAREVLAEGSR